MKHSCIGNDGFLPENNFFLGGGETMGHCLLR